VNGPVTPTQGIGAATRAPGRAQTLALVAVILVAVLGPLGLRAVNRLSPGTLRRNGFSVLVPGAQELDRREPDAPEAGDLLLPRREPHRLSLWAEWRWPDLTPRLSGAGGADRPAPASADSRPHLGVVASQACLCGVLFALILVLRSRTALDFIYFQF